MNLTYFECFLFAVLSTTDTTADRSSVSSVSSTFPAPPDASVAAREQSDDVDVGLIGGLLLGGFTLLAIIGVVLFIKYRRSPSSARATRATRAASAASAASADDSEYYEDDNSAMPKGAASRGRLV